MKSKQKEFNKCSDCGWKTENIKEIASPCSVCIRNPRVLSSRKLLKATLLWERHFDTPRDMYISKDLLEMIKYILNKYLKTLEQKDKKIEELFRRLLSKRVKDKEPAYKWWYQVDTTDSTSYPSRHWYTSTGDTENGN